MLLARLFVLMAACPWMVFTQAMAKINLIYAAQSSCSLSPSLETRKAMMKFTVETLKSEEVVRGSPPWHFSMNHVPCAFPNNSCPFPVTPTSLTFAAPSLHPFSLIVVGPSLCLCSLLSNAHWMHRGGAKRSVSIFCLVWRFKLFHFAWWFFFFFPLVDVRLRCETYVVLSWHGSD